MTWLGVITLVISKWSSSLRDFLTMEQVLRPLHVPGKFTRSDKSSLVSFRLGVLGMISLTDKNDGIKVFLSSCHCFLIHVSVSDIFTVICGLRVSEVAMSMNATSFLFCQIALCLADCN
jgi:hypothetical protein